jgi:hypothetical protein
MARPIARNIDDFFAERHSEKRVLDDLILVGAVNDIEFEAQVSAICNIREAGHLWTGLSEAFQHVRGCMCLDCGERLVSIGFSLFALLDEPLRTL